VLEIAKLEQQALLEAKVDESLSRP
jgi:hypothetical protein